MGKIDLSKLKDLMKGLAGVSGVDLARGDTFGVRRGSDGGLADGQQFKTEGGQRKCADRQPGKGNVETVARRRSGGGGETVSGCIPAGREPDKVVIGREHST
jgi:hypothetical protein